jgi:phenylacetate-CoA ligase
MHPIPRSIVQGISWPAITDGMSLQLMALQFQLEQSQWWTAEELLKSQLTQISPLLNYAYKNNTFYQAFYRQKNYRPKKLLTPENWLNIPIVKRENIQAAGESLISLNLPSQHGQGVDITTSGSTGKPITVKSNQVTQLIWNGLTLREHLWHKRNLKGKLAVIRLPRTVGRGLPPNGSAAKNWGNATTLYDTGPSYLLDIRATIEQQINWLQKHNPEYLLTYPSNLMALLDAIVERSITLPKLKQLRTLGEIVYPHIRQRCKDILGVDLVDTYSCQEAGCLAIQCPDHTHYHVQNEGIILEVLDDHDKPCLPGQIGRIVISSLHNFATPLIRYEIGDYAEVGTSCDCGRGLPVLTQILGRVRNMLTYPNGKKHWPFVDSSEYRRVADIQQFQLIQTSLENIEVHLVAREQISESQQHTLSTIIQDSLGYPFNISYHFHKDIPCSSGGKYEEFISRV